jgi:esterase
MKLFCRKLGSGPPLMILHGLYGSSDNWMTIARVISEKFTVYLPDLRNHGQSPHSPVHDYESMSNDISELIEDLQLKKLSLAGHSMGGKIAVNLARKWPEKISHLIIMDVYPFNKSDPSNRFLSEHTMILNSLKSVDLNGIKKRAEAELLIEEKIDTERIRNLVLKNLLRLPDNTFTWKLNIDSLIGNLGNIVNGLKEPEPEEAITGFPVLFIKGELSDYITVEEMKTVRILFPAVELIIVKNAGHWLHADKPETIIEIFLNLF